MAKWLRLRDEFSRALDPIISDPYLQQVPAVTHLGQVGPGLEALGYLLLKKRDGVGSQSAKESVVAIRAWVALELGTRQRPRSGASSSIHRRRDSSSDRKGRVRARCCTTTASRRPARLRS